VVFDEGKLGFLGYMETFHFGLALFHAEFAMGRHQNMAPQMDNDLFDVKEGHAGLLLLPELESGLIEDFVIGLIQNYDDIIGLCGSVFAAFVDVASEGA
jgi:hypothetical protein